MGANELDFDRAIADDGSQPAAALDVLTPCHEILSGDAAGIHHPHHGSLPECAFSKPSSLTTNGKSVPA